MRRTVTTVLSLGLSVVLFGGGALAQDDTIGADGGVVSASDDVGSGIATGEGDTIIYGDVATGRQGGEVLGDPNAVYQPDLSMIPRPAGASNAPTIVGIPVGSATAGNLINGIDINMAAEMAAQAEAETVVDETAPVEDVTIDDGATSSVETTDGASSAS